MLKKVRAAVKRDNKSLILAALLSLGFFALNTPSAGPGYAHLARHISQSLGMFFFLYLIFALFSSAFRSHMGRELHDLEGVEFSRRLLRLFIFYKEGVKVVVGVSFTLGWIAGLVFIVDHFQDRVFLLPLISGLLFSALVFSATYVFVTFIDHIRYPRGH